jgi:RNA-directed DNA polymerase
MSRWRPQQYCAEGERRGVDHNVLTNAIEIGNRIAEANSEVPTIFTLRHLAALASVDYGFLRAVVGRGISDPYTVFRIRKSAEGETRRTGYRTICVPDRPLMRTQGWIAHRILAHVKPHSASYAYAPGSKIVEAAQPHCARRWLVKIDVRRFFDSCQAG